MKALLKKYIPNSLWAYVRKKRILHDHARVGTLCDEYIKSYYSGEEGHFNLVPKKDLAGKKIIWQYWAQGFDTEKMPQLVLDCLASVEKYKGEYEIIRLSDNDIVDYVDLPDFVYERKKTYTTTSFSNVLRLALLSLYGGCWLDATVYLTGPIDVRYSTYDFFMFQRDQTEPNKKYWENTYAYYFGWEPQFKVRVLTSIAFSKPGASFTNDYLNLLLLVWQKNPVYPFYFTFQVLFNQLVASGKSQLDCPVENDCVPHMLMQVINDPGAPFNVGDAVNRCSMHKLTFKNIDYKEFCKCVECL